MTMVPGLWLEAKLTVLRGIIDMPNRLNCFPRGAPPVSIS